MFKPLLTAALALVISFNVFADADEERQEARDMRKEVLAKLYKERPSVKSQIAKSEGYAVFSNVGVNIIFFSAGGGSGIVRDNASGKDTYMNMATGGIGLGLGVKDFAAVFVFTKRKAMTDFIESGWDFSGQADAAAKSGEKGGSAAGSGTVLDGVEIFQMTEAGLAIQATLQGTKYWVDSDLN